MTKPRFGHLKSRRWRYLSWGVGVQSTRLACMSVLGEIDPFDAIIFSDTRFERRRTYEMFDFYSAWLMDRGANVLRISGGDIRQEGAAEHVHVPFWTGSGGPLQRQCTPHFKIEPMRREMRRLAGFPESRNPHPAKGQFDLVIGISLDEWERMSVSDVQYVKHVYPLVDMGINRWDCEAWFEQAGLPNPGKSACIGCPYRQASEWLDMRENSPEEWAEAVAFDQLNRDNPLAVSVEAERLYVYRGRRGPVALAEADLEGDALKERKVKQLDFCVGGFCHV